MEEEETERERVDEKGRRKLKITKEGRKEGTMTEFEVVESDIKINKVHIVQYNFRILFHVDYSCLFFLLLLLLVILNLTMECVKLRLY